MRIYLELENKHIDYINKLYYSICDYLYLDIEPWKIEIKNGFIRRLSSEEKSSYNYGDL